MLLIPTFASEMSGVLSKLLDEQFLPLVARVRVYAQTWPGPFLTHVTIEIGLSHIFRSNSFKTHK